MAGSASTATPRLRFAIMCGGVSVPAWQASAIRQLLDCDAVEPVLLILESGSADGPVDRRRGPASACTVLFRSWLQRRMSALRPVDLSAELGALPAVRCAERPSPQGAGSAEDDGLATIRACRPDFILQLVRGEIRTGLLETARLGVWSYELEEEQPDRCWPATFREFARGSRTLTTALLQRDGRDRGEATVLHRGCFRAERSYARTVDGMLFGAADWCARACREIAASGAAGRGERAFQRRLEGPTNAEFVRFLARRATAFVHGAYRRFFLVESWNVGIVDAPVERLVAAGRPANVRWLLPPSGARYQADPFAVATHPDVILVEEYSHRLRKGWLSSIDLASADARPRRIASFDRAAHLSYPFLLSLGKDVFCIPECAQERHVELYRAVEFPDRWQKVARLVVDFAALDSTIARYRGRWWLFCTSADPGGEHKLHAWHARQVHGPWHPHALNPLKLDVRSSRPAGRPFMVDGVLYRPAQDCSSTYGGAITINRVDTLTPTDFSETEAGRIDPAPDGRYPAGLHTVCGLGDRTIIDGKRLVFDLRAALFRSGLLGGISKRPSARPSNPIPRPQQATWL